MMQEKYVPISVVIPVQDEHKSLPQLIESLICQTSIPEEIIFVNAGSRDNTPEIVSDYQRKHSFLKLINCKRVYPGVARNIGVQNAMCDLIAFTDAGIVVDPQWLSELYKVMQKDPNVDVVYGNYSPLINNFFQKMAMLAYTLASQMTEEGLTRPPSIASSLLKKKVWQEVGGFPDFRAAEDRIFMKKIEGEKFCIKRAPKAEVKWQFPASFKKTFERFRLYSSHDLHAGVSKDWHRGVLKIYGISLTFFILLSLVYNVYYAVMGTILFFLVRSSKRLLLYRWESHNRLQWFNPISHLFIILILCTADLACIVGFMDWIKRNESNP